MNLATLQRENKPVDARPAGIDEAEWAVRVDLAAAYRLIEYFGMADLIYNHITARVPGAGHAILINEFGLHYSEIAASNLVKIDLDGNVLDGSERRVNLAGYIIHSCIHGARADVQCVLHTHSHAVMAVSCLDEGFIPMEQEGLQFYNRIAYHDYEGLAVDPDEQSRLVADLGTFNTILLRNHGAVTVGATVSEAFRRMYYLESACRVQLDVMHSGAKLRLPPPEVCEHTARQWEDGAASIGGGAKPTFEWEAMKRLLDRKDPSYRQ